MSHTFNDRDHFCKADPMMTPSPACLFEKLAVYD